MTSGGRGHSDGNQSDGGRIFVLQRDRRVPLMPGVTAGARSLPRTQLWRHTLLEHHRVGAMEIPEHEHDHLCLHLQLAGSPALEWWNEGRNQLVHTAPGAMILVGAGTRDRVRWSEANQRVILSMRPELLADTARELGVGAMVDPAAMRNRWDLRDGALENAVQRMYREAAEGFPLGALYAGLLESELATLLIRRHSETWLPEPNTRGQLPLPKLRRALEFLTENLHRDVRLEEAAAAVELSPFHFAREFRATTGETPYQYLLTQRMERARVLLTTTDWSVQEIAAQTGFASAASFVRAFRQRVGATPAAWRRQPA